MWVHLFFLLYFYMNATVVLKRVSRGAFMWDWTSFVLYSPSAPLTDSQSSPTDLTFSLVMPTSFCSHFKFDAMFSKWWADTRCSSFSACLLFRASVGFFRQRRKHKQTIIIPTEITSTLPSISKTSNEIFSSLTLLKLSPNILRTNFPPKCFIFKF